MQRTTCQIFSIFIYPMTTLIFRYKMVPSSINSKWGPSGECPWRSVQIENTRVCSGSDSIGCVRPRNGWRSSSAKQSKFEDHARRHIDQMIRTRNFKARNERFETSVLVRSQKGEIQRWEESGRVISGRQLDSVQEETLVVSATDRIVDRKHNRPLLLQKRGHRLTCRQSLKGKCTAPSCNFWHPPVCQNYQSESGCKVGDQCLFRQTEAGGQPSKKSKKSSGTGSVAILWRSVHHWVVCSKSASEKVYVAESWNVGTHHSNSPKARGTT